MKSCLTLSDPSSNYLFVFISFFSKIDSHHSGGRPRNIKCDEFVTNLYCLFFIARYFMPVAARPLPLQVLGYKI